MDKIERYHRRSVRLRKYDYSQTGAYFITIVTQSRECLFGNIVHGDMKLNNIGLIVKDEWVKTAEIRNNIELDRWVVMPDHFHGIIVVSNGRGTARRAPTVEQFGKPVVGSVPTIIRSFKSAVTNRVNKMYQTPGGKLWQRNYWEHIIRTNDELIRIREYILQNPINWQTGNLNDYLNIRDSLN